MSVKLKSIEKNPLAIYDGYSTQTLANGDFQLQDVEPGRYVLMAEGAGFMATKYGAEGSEQTGTPIELKAGQWFFYPSLVGKKSFFIVETRSG